MVVCSVELFGRVSQIAAASDALNQILEEVFGPLESMESAVAVTVQALQGNNEQLKINARKIAVVEVLAELAALFEEFERQLIQHQHHRAAAVLYQIGMIVPRLPESLGHVEVIRSQTAQQQICRQRLEEALASRFSEAVVRGDGSISISVVDKCNQSVGLGPILSAAHYIGHLETYWMKKCWECFQGVVKSVCAKHASL